MNNGAASPDGDATTSVRQALVHLDRNEIPQSERLLSAILAETPADPQALQLLGVVRRMQGRLREAEELYRRSLAIQSAQPQVHYNLGNLLKASNRFDESIEQQREAIRLKPNYAEAHLALALALSARGDHAAAEQSCRDCLRFQPNYLPARLTLAAELCALDRAGEAELLLRQALVTGMRDPALIAAFEYNLGVALKQQKKFSDALSRFDAAQTIAPHLPGVDYSRGNTLQQLGRLEEAAACYRKALARDGASLDALSCLALVCAQLGDLAETRECAAKALALDSSHPIAAIALAIAEIEAGAFDLARQRLRHVLDDPAFAGDPQAAFAAGFAADAFDRRDRIGDAFEICRDSNEARRAAHMAAFENSRVIDDAARLAEHFRKSAPWSARRANPDKVGVPAQHVFVLGFMRSGTTLLETILATDPKVVHIDEIEFLTDAARAFLLTRGGLDRLSTLDDDEAAEWRDAYWKSIRAAGFSAAGTIFVDKMPFNTLRLPLIARLFPSAKVIFAVRDPRDVVLSCFRRRFNPSPYSYEFFRLEDCARFYSATMALADIYREKLPLDIRDHRYEDMIADFEPSLRAVCDFVGMEWNARMRDFQTMAEAIDRRSASAAQVRRGLFAEAAGQWRRYRDQLAPVLPILAPWAARFGYPAS